MSAGIPDTEDNVRKINLINSASSEEDSDPGPGLQLDTMKPGDRVMVRRPFPPSYSEAMYGVQQADNLGTAS